MAFYRGQKVVCVHPFSLSRIGKIIAWFDPPVVPTVGTVYTVAAARSRYIVGHGTVDLIDLVEIMEPRFSSWIPGFNAQAFRPLVERKTDIGFAHEILRKVTKRQGADA